MKQRKCLADNSVCYCKVIEPKHKIFQGIHFPLYFTCLPTFRKAQKKKNQPKNPNPALTFCTRAFTTNPGNKLERVQFCRSVARDAATSDRSMDKRTTLPSFFTSTMTQFRLWPIFNSGPTKTSHSVKPPPETLRDSLPLFPKLFQSSLYFRKLELLSI